jgi:ATP-binding cassette subfamily B protein
MWRFLKDVSKPYWFLLFIMAMAPWSNGVLSFAVNYSVKTIIDLFTLHEVLTLSQAMKPIIILALGMFTIDGMWRLNGFLQLKTLPYLRRDIASKAYSELLQNEYKYFVDNGCGSITSKIKGITDGCYAFWEFIGYKITEPLSRTTASIIALFIVNKKLAALVLISGIAKVALIGFLYNKSAKLGKIDALNYHKLMGFISDKVSNIFTVFSFATRKIEADKIKQFCSNQILPASKNVYRWDLIINCIFMVIYWAEMFTLFGVTIWLRNKHLISTGDIVFAISSIDQFYQAIWQSQQAMGMFAKHIAELKASFSILPEKSKAPYVKQGCIFTSNDVEFKNVCFSYNDEEFMQNMSFFIRSGEKIGIVGHSGAGKTTLINLLTKYCEPQSGHIFIGGKCIANISSDCIRQEIAVIPQDAQMFHATIAENITYGKQNATLDEIVTAAQHANIHDFILTLPNGYYAITGENGVKLSGGQRQRIAIARAILKNAKILILDEATSHLDSSTENAIVQSINNILQQSSATVIVAAHRISTIKHVDRIVVLERGKVVECDTFDNLLKIPNGHFVKLYNAQYQGVIL